MEIFLPSAQLNKQVGRKRVDAAEAETLAAFRFVLFPISSGPFLLSDAS